MVQTDVSVSSVLSSVRETRQQTLEAFASELGVSRQAVHQWESGATEPGPERITAWVNDSREWVSRLGRQLFEARFGVRVSKLPAGELPASQSQEQPA